jgi:hypothetical protein
MQNKKIIALKETILDNKLNLEKPKINNFKFGKNKLDFASKLKSYLGSAVKYIQNKFSNPNLPLPPALPPSRSSSYPPPTPLRNF